MHRSPQGGPTVDQYSFIVGDGGQRPRLRSRRDLINGPESLQHTCINLERVRYRSHARRHDLDVGYLVTAHDRRSKSVCLVDGSHAILYPRLQLCDPFLTGMRRPQKGQLMLGYLLQQLPRGIESIDCARAIVVGGSAKTLIHDDFYQGVWVRVPSLQTAQPVAVDDEMPPSVIPSGGCAIARRAADGQLARSPRVAIAARQRRTSTFLPVGVAHTSS